MSVPRGPLCQYMSMNVSVIVTQHYKNKTLKRALLLYFYLSIIWNLELLLECFHIVKGSVFFCQHYI